MLKQSIGWVSRLYDHFDTLPKRVSVKNSRFYSVSNLAQTLAWMAHLVWFFVFANLGVGDMAAIQLGSIFIYILAILLNRRGKHMESMFIALAEIVGHQLCAAHYIGLDSGYQYFIPVVAIFPFLMPEGRLYQKILLLLMCTTGFIYIEFFMPSINPVYKLAENTLFVFKATNIALSFGFTGLWALYLNVAIARAETIIQKHTKELAVAEQKIEQEKISHELMLKERDNEIYKLRNIELKESYEAILEKNRQIEAEKNKSYQLLLNILPEETAAELLSSGKAVSRRFEMATVLFADFVGFSKTAAALNPEDLVKQIDAYFSGFDEIIQKHHIEKIKTIGDAYMAAGGVPLANDTHAINVADAAFEMQKFTRELERDFRFPFELRIGIHTGTLVAGVVGNHKFQYDIWGDAVNVAARLEQNSEPGRINISGATCALIKDRFEVNYRGKIEAKNIGEIDMYFLGGIQSNNNRNFSSLHSN